MAAFPTLKLTGVRVTDRELGHGSYATVLELKYMGLKCAGKKIHEQLLEQGDASYTIRRFEEECRLLSQVRHPNIVQFLGVYFQQRVQVPILVMEFLPTNLTSCIEQYRMQCGILPEEYGTLPKEISYSILHDVALGLCYLHGQTPPIIHRDLSSNNVLLTPNMTAKISDLGVARILNLTPLHISHMTQTPGTPAYMPPEVMVADPKYDTSVDEFSYGIMMIHIFSGQWPEPKIGPVYTKPDGTMIPKSEAERREMFLKTIGNDHPLPVMDLIKKCIHNHPEARAHAGEIVERLAEMVLQFPASFANRLEQITAHENQSIDEKERRELQAEIRSLKNDPAKIRSLLLYHASSMGNTDEVKELLVRGADANMQNEDDDHNAALIKACQKGYVETAKALLDFGANVGCQNKNGQSALHCASSAGMTECVEMLLNYGAQVNLPDNDGNTALIKACQKGHEGVTVLLLVHGADHGYQNKNGQSALHCASSAGMTKCVEMLLDCGAQVNLLDNDGNTALIKACQKGCEGVTVLLLDHGAGHGYQNKFGQSALHCASSAGMTECVRVLVEYGAQVDLRDENGNTALINTCGGGRVEIARALLVYGCGNPNIQNNDGNTALHKAAQKNDVEIVQMLVKFGAAVEIRNKEGLTALDVARGDGYQAVCELLEPHTKRELIEDASLSTTQDQTISSAADKKINLGKLPSLDELLILKYVDEGEKKKLRIISEASHKWKDIASLICNDINLTAKLEQKHRGNAEECLLGTFIEFFINRKPQYYSQDWNGLIELLDDVGLESLAKNVEHALPYACT